jgi:hypothetical protein
LNNRCFKKILAIVEPVQGKVLSATKADTIPIDFVMKLGAKDISPKEVNIKFFLLNYLARKGYQVPDGIIVNLDQFYNRLELLFGGKIPLLTFLDDIFSSEKLETRQTFIESADSVSVRAGLEAIENEINFLFSRFSEELQSDRLIFRGGDDDFEAQAGCGYSDILTNPFVQTLKMIWSYMKNEVRFDRDENATELIPYHADTLDTCFYRQDSRPQQIKEGPSFSHHMLALVQIVPASKFAGTVAIDGKFVRIEVSDQLHYHGSSGRVISICIDLETSEMHSEDLSSLEMTNSVLIENCRKLEQLVLNVQKDIQKINPRFTKLELEMCLNLFEPELSPFCVQAKLRFSKKENVFDPRSGVFKYEFERSYETSSIEPIVLQDEADFDLLGGSVLGLVRLEDWPDSRRFPDISMKKYPKGFVLNAGTEAYHLISRVKGFSRNITARLQQEDFDLLWHVGQRNNGIVRERQRRVTPDMGWQQRSEALRDFEDTINISLERDFSVGKFGCVRWQKYGYGALRAGIFDVDIQSKVNAPAIVGDLKEEVYARQLHLQRLSGLSVDYINPSSSLVHTTASYEDECEVDAQYSFNGDYFQTTIDGVGIRLLELNTRGWGGFEELDPSKYLQLAPKNLINYLVRSGLIFNLTLLRDGITGANLQSTHLMMSNVFHTGTPVRACSQNGRVRVLDVCDAKVWMNREKAIVASPEDLMNGLATLKRLGIDIKTEVDYASSSEELRFELARQMLLDSRFDQKDIFPILGKVIIDIDGVKAILPFNIYRTCLLRLGDSAEDEALLIAAIKREIVCDSLGADSVHQVFYPSDEWIRDACQLDMLPSQLTGLLIIEPAGSDRPDSSDSVKESLRIFCNSSWY